MDVLLTLVVLTLPSVSSGLQTCSSGTETSSNQVILDVSSAQINTGGGMCSCRLTVSQRAQVEMFPIGWTQQCDTYMTIQRWKTSTQCTNGVVPTPTLTKTVTTGEEIWILVVAARPGARLLGQLLFKLKSSSDKLSLECFEPNTNGSTTNTPSTTTQTTQPMTTTADAITSLLTTRKGWTRPKPNTTNTPSTTQTTQPMTTAEAITSLFTTAKGWTRVKPNRRTESFTAIPYERHSQRQSETSPDSSRIGPNMAICTCKSVQPCGAVGLSDGSQDVFPSDIFAAGIATGGGVAIIVQVIYFFIIKPRCRTSCHKSPADFPVSEDHPTYAGFSNRAEDTGNNYDVLSPAQVITNPYTNEQ